MNFRRADRSTFNDHNLKGQLDIIVRNDDSLRMRYPGGKFRCFQKLISLIPPHRVYIETHLGGGAVLRNKLPAEQNVGIDRDPTVVANYVGFPATYKFFTMNCLEWLGLTRLTGDEFIYADPPYLPSTRFKPKLYRHDYSEADHVELLNALKSLPCPVMVTGYPSRLYQKELVGWHVTSFLGTSHVGARLECAWTNYRPGPMHDPRYIGWDFRGRQAWRRKQERWVKRFAGLSQGEQQAMLLCLKETFERSSLQSISLPCQ